MKRKEAEEAMRVITELEKRIEEAKLQSKSAESKFERE